VSARGLIRPQLIASPTQVAGATAAMLVSGELPRHVAISLQEFALGFAPAVGVGVLLGVLLGRSRRLRWLLDPPIMALYSTPRITLIPMLVIWFGIGMESKVVVVFLGAVFPILVNTQAGVRHVDPVWVRAARSLGAGPWAVLVKVLLPGALGPIITGIRLGVGRGLISVIVGEMYVSTGGVGQAIQAYGNAGRAAEVISLAVLVALFGYASVTGLGHLERRLTPWRQLQDA
jgi:NitT/TauT family transport system permease protein